MRNSLGIIVPRCKCGSFPTGRGEVDGDCPQCSAYRFECGLVDQLIGFLNRSVKMQMHPPRWVQIIPLQPALSESPPRAEHTSNPGTPTTGLPHVNKQPRKPLTDWHAITAALEMKYGDREKIKDLNKAYDGPIRNSGRGTSPIVYLDDLIEWWNHLDVKAQELANQREGKKLSAEDQHNFGRDGIAAPEIGGGVKERRSDRTPA